MKKSTLFAIRTIIVFAAFLWILSSLAEAATIQVDCSSASLQAAIEKAKSGDTLLVSGTCNENLVIPEDVQKITLDGQGKATIKGRDPKKDTIFVRGRVDVTVRGFTITGGRDGIMLVSGATALVDGNTIENTSRFGIYVTQHSSARIVNNTIQNIRGKDGISVSGSAFIYVGMLGYLNLQDKTASPNTIQNNGRFGIHVHRTSYARIAGNTISNNKNHGIHVGGVSHAQIGSNNTNGNGGDGIFVAENSGVNRGADKGKKILHLPNNTTVANKGFGIRCIIGGSANGRIGTLTGAKGAKRFGEGCIDSLKP